MGGSHASRVGAVELVPSRAVRTRAAGKVRRHIGIGDLGLGAGDDPHPGHARPQDRGKHDHVVENDHRRLEPGDQLLQGALGAYRGVDDRIPGRRDIGVYLRERRQPERVPMALYEGVPIGGRLGRLVGGRRDRILLKAVRREDAAEAGVANEDRFGAQAAQLLGDPDAVQCGAVAGLGKECDGLVAAGHVGFVWASPREGTHLRGNATPE